MHRWLLTLKTGWFTSKFPASLLKARVPGRLLDYSVLESRQLLAANLYYDADTLVLTVISDDAADRLDVTEDVSGNLTATILGGDSQGYSAGQVSEIRYYANGGNDEFYNSSSVPAVFGAGAGDDIFVGGSANDWAFGASGQDQLDGGGGDDYLSGGDGSDTVIGGAGNDTLHGGNDNDSMYGGLDDDTLWGEFGDDLMRGGDGADSLYGFSGADDLDGGLGNDLVYGQAHDDIVRGSEGDDRVRGNNGNDTLYGGDGNDFMMADHGDDVGYGGAGDDILLAHYGTDRLEGGDGNDQLIGEYDTNTLLAGSGDDLIIGGSGTDYAYGEDGADLIYGRDGNDHLFGGLGVDRLLGESGDDALFGGEFNSADTLIGNAGNDRFLQQANDLIDDQESGDAVLEFIDYTSSWNDIEIGIMAEAFTQLYEAVGNNLLLQETLNDDNLRLIKYADLGGAAGINYLETSTSWYWQNGEQIFSYSYYREIRILDWNESSEFYNDQFQSVMIHEIAHNWDSDTELGSVASSLAPYWNSFMALSGWTDVDPGSGYSASLDGQWWYADSAVFTENYGRSNPYEDLATVFEYYFESGSTSSNSGINDKLNIVDSIFAELALL